MANRRSIKETNLAKKRAIARTKACRFCVEKSQPRWSDYEKMSEYVSPRAKIIGRSYTGVCTKHQRLLAVAIKQARHLGLLAFSTGA